MTLAPWQSPLARALHRNRSLAHVRHVQLATVRQDGRPANRTVVFRGFLDNTNSLKFATDRRSEKADQIAFQNWGEVCWYFPKTREQFRFLGELILVDNEYPDATLLKARKAQWHDLSDPGRSQFTWSHPKKPRATDDNSFHLPPPEPTEPLPHFCLVLLNAIEVDHLELKGDPQNRYLYQRGAAETEWTVQEVNP